MRSASEAFANVVAGSHRIVTRVDVLFDRTTILEGLAVTAGTVRFDRRAERLARCEITVADPTLVPVANDDVLTPYGYELQLWRGVSLGATDELVPLGVFPIQSSKVDGVTLGARIVAEDRSRLVSDARFEDDYQIASGTNPTYSLNDLIFRPRPGGLILCCMCKHS